MTLLTGRGACGHPDGFTRLLDSMLRTFGDDVRDHLHDRPCRGSLSRPVIPVSRVGHPQVADPSSFRDVAAWHHIAG